MVAGRGRIHGRPEAAGGTETLRTLLAGEQDRCEGRSCSHGQWWPDDGHGLAMVVDVVMTTMSERYGYPLGRPWVAEAHEEAGHMTAHGGRSPREDAGRSWMENADRNSTLGAAARSL